MATIYQHGSSFHCSTEHARAALSQFGRFTVTVTEVKDRNGDPFNVAVVWGIKAPEVRIIVEDI